MSRRRSALFVAWIGVAVGAFGQTEADRLELAFPTDNDALLRGGGPEFYQYIERDYKGAKSKPWQGGRYGFVRNPIATSAGIVYTRFHEGIDIRPLHRAADGEPLDEVRAIAAGKVVYTNLVPSFSNYGNYIVIEHRWDGASYYSLYGHLSSVRVRVGQEVSQRETIAVMGHTGEGLSQARAHLHLELNLMFNRHFEGWHDTFFKADPNHHGIFNGINLAGIDIARLYLALEKDRAMTIPRFLAQEQIFYKVAMPNSPNFELPKLYSWLVADAGEGRTNAAAWEVSFNRAGVPLKVERRSQPVPEPEIAYVRKGPVDYSYLTRGVVGGRGETVMLTDSGKRLMRLLIYPE
ncbi:MAG: M23 family metallopeptidase [Chthoniobacterales bacterium]